MDIIIFDYDGVIADSLETVISIYNKLASEYKLEKISDKKDFTELFNGNFFIGLNQSGIDPQVANNLLEEIADGLASKAKEIPLFSGVKEVLEKLSQNYKIMIITSNLSRVIESSLKANNIRVIEEVIGADKEKSKVKKIEKVKKKYPESKIYYVGDTTGDIYEGREAKVTTIGVTWGFHSIRKITSSKPDFLVNSPKELLSIF